MCMNCNLSRSQKAKANDRQKKILNAIAEQSKQQHKYGEYYMILRFFNKLYDIGIEPFESIEDKNTMLFALKLGEAIRILQSYRKQQADDSQIEYEYHTANLFIGQVVSNYKELCRLLGTRPKTGKSRQLQEKDFLRYFDYEKLQYSNEYLILDIYDEPLKKNERAKNSLYCNALKLMIMYELSKAPMIDKDGVYTIYTTFNKLIRKLEILSIFFDKDISNYLINKYLELTKQDYLEVNDNYFKQKLSIFRTVIKRKHKGNIDYALKRLKEQNIIHYDSYSIIVERIDGKKNYRQADFNEEVIIESTKREAAKALGYPNSNIASLYSPKAYHDKLNELYHKKGWLYVFNQIKIGADYKMLSTPINEYTNYSILDCSVLDLSDNEKDQYKQAYIENMKSSSLKKAENNHTKAKQQIVDDEAKVKIDNNQYTYSDIDEMFGITPDSFLRDIDNAVALQKLFIEYFINPDEEAILECNGYYDT